MSKFSTFVLAPKARCYFSLGNAPGDVMSKLSTSVLAPKARCYFSLGQRPRRCNVETAALKARFNWVSRRGTPCLTERQVHLDPRLVCLVDAGRFRHQAFALGALGRKQMAA